MDVRKHDPPRKIIKSDSNKNIHSEKNYIRNKNNLVNLDISSISKSKSVNTSIMRSERENYTNKSHVNSVRIYLYLELFVYLSTLCKWLWKTIEGEWRK